MRQFLIAISLVVLAFSLIVSQQKSDRVVTGASGTVRTVRIEQRQIMALTYFQYGVMVDTAIYDSNGRVLESADYQAGSNPDTKRTSVYDEHGNEIEYALYTHGSLTHRVLYKYDSMNRKIEDVDVYPDGTERSKSIFRYPKRLTQIRLEVRPNGSTWQGSVSVLDDHGRELKRIEYDESGEVKHKYTYSYDVHGNKTSETDFYQDNGRPRSSKETYAYNDGGFLIEEAWYSNGVLKNKTTYKRDAHGNANEVVKSDGSGRMTEKQVWAFEFDSGEDWVRAVISEWSDKKPSEPVQPTIEIRRIFRTVNEATCALWSAAEEGDLSRVEKLLRDGADSNISHPDGGTALIKSAAKGKIEVVRALLKARAQVDASDADGWTALMWSAENGLLEIVKLLLASGADPNAKNNVDAVAIMPASSNGHVDVVKLLLDKGADINAAANDGSTALMVAAGEGMTEAVKFLLSNGANKDMKTTSGRTALFFGARSDSPDTVRLLLESGLDVNARAKDGTTPLMMASFGSGTDVLKLLILSGADINLRNDEGKTALDQAVGYNNTKAVEVLKKAGAK